MTDYEHIVISAVRYALGRMTYIVEITVNYIMQQIEDDKLSDECLKIIKRDIEEELKINGMFDSDRRQWVRLKTKIEGVK